MSPTIDRPLPKSIPDVRVPTQENHLRTDKEKILQLKDQRLDSQMFPILFTFVHGLSNAWYGPADIGY